MSGFPGQTTQPYTTAYPPSLPSAGYGGGMPVPQHTTEQQPPAGSPVMPTVPQASPQLQPFPPTQPAMTTNGGGVYPPPQMAANAAYNDGKAADNKGAYYAGGYGGMPPPPLQQSHGVHPDFMPPSGPNGQYTVEDYQRMAQARLPRFPVEQYGRCPKDAGEHYVREEYSNGSLCCAFLFAWCVPVCVSKEMRCRKCGQRF